MYLAVNKVCTALLFILYLFLSPPASSVLLPVSAVTPLKVDEFSLKFARHPDQQKVPMSLRASVMALNWVSTPLIDLIQPQTINSLPSSIKKLLTSTWPTTHHWARLQAPLLLPHFLIFISAALR